MCLRRLCLLFLTALCLIPLPALAATPAEDAAIAAARQDHTAYTLPAAELVKAHTLAQIGTVEFFLGTLWSFLLLWLLLQTGAATRMRNVAVNLTKNPTGRPRKRLGQALERWAQCALFLLQLLVAIRLLELPLALYAHTIGLRYGLSVQGWPSWLLDLFKSFILEYLVAVPLVYLLFWRLRRSPRTWWLQMALLVWVFSIAGTFLVPIVVDPLFNTFEPLSKSNPALVAQLERVVAHGRANADGITIPPDRMYLMKASAKTTTLNAYVTGFGSSKRVVVWDTSLNKGTPDEILFIFGHEMGHYVLGHILMGVWFSLGFLLVSFLLGFHALRWTLARFGKRWKIPAPEHWAALVVLLLLFRVLYFAEEPLISLLSRQDEHAADVYGQEAVHGIVADPQQTAQQAFDVLGEASLDDPAPRPFAFWYDTHPTTAFRAAFARHYNPWTPGNAPRYFKR